MNRRFALAGLLLLATVAVGCHKISHGQVVEKEVVPEHVMFMPVMVGKVVMMMPLYFPQSYRVSVAGRDRKGKPHIEDFYLEQPEFQRLNVGDAFSCGAESQKQCATEAPHWSDQ